MRPVPAPKYSSAMLRPPTIVAWLSTVNDLLCMRRFTRVKSVTKLSARASRLDERVVQAHLDVRMRVERGEGRIEPLRIQVVEQQPHAHPPLGRLPERLEQQVADLVAVPDEVLRVERLFGGVGEQDARGERIAGVGQRMDARLAGIRGDAGRDRAAEPSSRRVSQSGRLDAILWRGQCGAASDDHHERDQQGGQNAGSFEFFR